MADPSDPEISEALQPKPGDVSFDLTAALASVVGLRATVPEDASSARTLGTERRGHGVFIRDEGLVVTTGYLITEADSIWLADASGRVTQAHVLGSDSESGFGLLQALEPLNIAPMELGRSQELKVGESAIVAGFGGLKNAIRARVTAKREFAGYWEYLLDEAIFTAPAHPNWGGTALIDRYGRLAGVGSLFVQQAVAGHSPIDGNMMIPIDLLPPVLDDLVTLGRVNRPPRPWLGMLTADQDGKLQIASVTEGGPADEDGLRVGDLVVAVAGQEVADLPALYRRIWSLGSAGVEVPLTIIRAEETMEILIRSRDRAERLRRPVLH